ncbi:MAG: hypothetical protein N3D84_03195, partial [Candidatus Woesearchaeota archaeon]|nr:hypothetical protein [Candidatus Woesearchaeota archaeon]
LIDSDEKAEWALKKIAEEKAEAQKYINVCRAMIIEYEEKIRKKGNCNIFGEGVAYLKIFTTSPHNFVIYIGGGSSADTRKAGNILANYDEYVLEGRAIEITGPLSNPNLTMIIE